MSKAILVIEDTEVCAGCPLNFWNRCRALNEQHIENPSANRLPDCPLKELPDEVTVFMDDWADGYNACLEDVLGE